MSVTTNQSLPALRNCNNKIDKLNGEMDDFMRRQANGEKPDGEEFMKMIEKRTVASQAMQAQMKLHEKPIKTVLNETK